MKRKGAVLQHKLAAPHLHEWEYPGRDREAFGWNDLQVLEMDRQLQFAVHDDGLCPRLIALDMHLKPVGSRCRIQPNTKRPVLPVYSTRTYSSRPMLCGSR